MRALAMVIVWTATASAEPCHENRRCWWGDGLIIGVMGSALVATGPGVREPQNRRVEIVISGEVIGTEIGKVVTIR